MFDNELDPEVEKVRDQIIKKIGDKPLEEVNQIIKKLLNEQMDEVTRLGALAARVKIIRAKIEVLYDGTTKKQKTVNSKFEESSNVEKKSSESTDNWVRVKMLETGDINGKQIDKGVILDVQEEDATKLVQTKKAEIVDLNSDDASPIKKNEEQKKEENVKEKQEQQEKNIDSKKDEVTAGVPKVDKMSENEDNINTKKVGVKSDKESIKKSESFDSSNEAGVKENKVQDGINSSSIEKKENETSEEELLKIHEEREKKKLEEQKKEKNVDEKQETHEKDVDSKKVENTTGGPIVDKKLENKEHTDNKSLESEPNEELTKNNESTDDSNKIENKDN